MLTRLLLARVCCGSRGSLDCVPGSKPAMTRLLDLAVHQALDRGHQRTVFVADQRDGFAFGARAAGAADAVDVVLGDVRQVVVDDVRQRLDVEAARGDVGRDQHAQLVVLEALERAGACVLALVAVDRVGLDAGARRAAARGGWRRAWSCENTSTWRQSLALTRWASSSRLRSWLDRVLHLRDELGGRVAPRDLDGHRVLHERARELADLVGEGGREQQVLPLSSAAARGCGGCRG